PQMQFGRILHEALKDALGSIERENPLSWAMVDAAYVAAWARERFCAPDQAPSLQDLGRTYLRRAFDAGDLSNPLLLEQPFSLRADDRQRGGGDQRRALCGRAGSDEVQRLRLPPAVSQCGGLVEA